jgi:spermidine synthase
MKLFNKLKLQIIVFTSGAVVMIYEIVGSRVLAPHIGNSVYVWTGLISVILASLSLGYVAGGKKADKGTSYRYLSRLLFSSCLIIFLTNLVKDNVIETVLTLSGDVRIVTMVAATVLFAPASILLGVVTPYATRLKMTDLESSGSTVGNLNAMSTAGSILGTILAGYYLFSWLRTSAILNALAILLLILSRLIGEPPAKRNKILLGIFLYFLIIVQAFQMNELSLGRLDMDSAYQRIIIQEGYMEDPRTTLRVLRLPREVHSAVYLDSPELVFGYHRFSELAFHFNPEIKNVLALGGGGFTYPNYLAKNHNSIAIDVVEIDPELVEVAKNYFFLEDHSNLNIFFEDARSYMNRNDKEYDAIFIDVFSGGGEIPFQVATKEMLERLDASLSADGVVLVNIVAAVEGEKSHLLSAMYTTYAAIFPEVHIFLPNMADRVPTDTQNILLLALKNSASFSLSSLDSEYSEMLSAYFYYTPRVGERILTDAFAPVENLGAKNMMEL